MTALESITLERDALEAALAAVLDFAGTVAGGASWWDDVWPEYEDRIWAARASREPSPHQYYENLLQHEDDE